MAITSFNINGTIYPINTVYNFYGPARYEGRDLSSLGWSWASIKAAIDNGELDNFNVGDYMPVRIATTVPYNGMSIPVDYTIDMQIAGIDTYQGTIKTNGEDITINHHIDWISKDLFPVLKAPWATANDKFVLKNGYPTNTTSDVTNPFPLLNSNIKAFLNDTVFNLLPSEVQNVISSKKMIVEKRYSTDGTTYYKYSSEGDWVDVGKIWLPSEFEVMGTTMYGDRQYSAGIPVQYPIFAHNIKSRLKNEIKAQVDENTGYPIFDENGNLALYSDGSEGWMTMTICSEPWSAHSNVNVELLVVCLGKRGELNTLRNYKESVFPLCFRIEASI